MDRYRSPTHDGRSTRPGTGLIVDRRLRTATLASVAIFAFAALLLTVAGGSSGLFLTGIVLWGLTFGGAPTLLQTALADCAGDHADVAQSILVTVFNLAVAGGSLIGGLALNHAGAIVLPWLVVPLAIVALATAWRAGAHGFPSARRGV